VLRKVAVPATAHNLISENNNRADGNFSRVERLLCRQERQVHPEFVHLNLVMQLLTALRILARRGIAFEIQISPIHKIDFDSDILDGRSMSAKMHRGPVVYENPYQFFLFLPLLEAPAYRIVCKY
jgi:hypothetical protein